MARNHRLFLLDAYALIYRAHFAFIRNPLINSKGQNVSAVQGFLTTLHDLLRKEEPSHLAVVFDLGATNREAEHAFYKANREETPEDIQKAVPIIHEILKAFRIPIIELEGYEADDLIGTLAKQAERQGYTTYMVTPDKDYGQLVSEKIFMYKPAYMGNPVEILGVPEILEKWQIEHPEQVIDILGLMGDTADNIPGIPKVGPKTAMKLIGQYGSMEAVLADADNIKGKLGENLREFAEQGRISKQLATIILDAPVTFDEEDFLVEEPDTETLAALFSELEFRSLGKRILGDDYSVNATGAGMPERVLTAGQMDLFSGDAPASAVPPTVKAAAAAEGGKDLSNTAHDYRLADTPEKQNELAGLLAGLEAFCLDTETTGLDPNEAGLVGISFSWQAGSGWYVPVPGERDAAADVLDRLRAPLGDAAITKVGQNLKYDLIVLRRHGITVGGPLRDTMLAHYLLEPDKRHKMDYLAEAYLGYTPQPIEALIGKKGKGQLSMRDVPVEKVADYAAEDADVTWQLDGVFRPLVADAGLDGLYRDVELPLLRVLADLEYEGVALDTAFLEDYSKELAVDLERLRAEVHDLAGVDFNLDSPKQLGEVLFDKLDIPYQGKKTKTGQYSTSEDVLTRLAGDQPIVQKVLEYREIGKLKSTYVEALPGLVHPSTGRLHTTFSQTVAATGRLSSNNPNLQNIPIRTERGQRVRRAFVARDKDHVLLAADYSQVELRVIAALSGDEAMLEAFRSGLDIHAATAAKVYGVALEDVTSEHRRKAKMVNFGIVYGISAFGLSQRLDIPRKEAGELIDQYFATYPGVRAYMDRTIEQAREKGYVETILGRRRYLPDIASRNFTLRGHAERNAINSPVQGSAADLIKLAMIRLHGAMEKAGMRSRMTLQVHDELVFDAHVDELDELREMAVEYMQGAYDLGVPLVVETGTGRDWLEAH
jgi:DNA polymerase-1